MASPISAVLCMVLSWLVLHYIVPWWVDSYIILIQQGRTEHDNYCNTMIGSAGVGQSYLSTAMNLEFVHVCKLVL